MTRALTKAAMTVAVTTPTIHSRARMIRSCLSLHNHFRGQRPTIALFHGSGEGLLTVDNFTQRKFPLLDPALLRLMLFLVRSAADHGEYADLLNQ